MSPVLLASLISQLGTTGIPLIVKLWDDIQAGRTATTVAPADLLELHRLSQLSGQGIYANLGITPPSPQP